MQPFQERSGITHARTHVHDTPPPSMLTDLWHSPGQNGLTALMTAINLDQKAAVKQLLAAGADLNHETKVGDGVECVEGCRCGLFYGWCAVDVIAGCEYLNHSKYHTHTHTHIIPTYLPTYLHTYIHTYRHT